MAAGIGAAGHVDDPPMVTIQSMTTVGHAYHLAGIAIGEPETDGYPGALCVSLLDHLGIEMETYIEVYTATEEKELHESIATWQVMDLQTGQVRPSKIGERGLARLADRYMRIRVGDKVHGSAAQRTDTATQELLKKQQDTIDDMKMELDRACSTAAAAATAASAAATAASAKATGTSSSAPTNADSNVVALEETTCPTSKGTCRTLTRDEVKECFNRYEKHYGKGKRPLPEEEPTESQLAAILHLLETDQNPYCDLAVWVQYGDRTAKKQKCIGQVLNNKQEFVTIELVGPPNFEQWEVRFKILENALLMHNAVDLGNIQAYGKFMQRFNKKHGEQMFPLLYQADLRTRKEQFIRIRREGYNTYLEALKRVNNDPTQVDHPYDPGRPWNYVFQTVLEKEHAQWWHDELEHPALIIMSLKLGVTQVLGGDAPIAKQAPSSSPPGLLNNNPTLAGLHGQNYAGNGGGGYVPKGGGKNTWSSNGGAASSWEPAPKKIKVHHVSDGKYKTNRSGQELCEGYNKGTCASHPGSIMCPRNWSLAHQCSKCLDPTHIGESCNKTPPEEYRVPGNGAFSKGQEGKGQGYGKGKGKGKGKGYGKGKGKGWWSQY